MKKELVIKILKSLDEKSEVPFKEDLGLDLEQYGELLEIMQQGNLIFGANITRAGQGNKVTMVFTDNIKITVNGIEYLENNK